jgi:four helix bundle protein
MANGEGRKAKGERQKRASDFQDLRVWQAGREIVRSVYSITRGFPREEVFGLTAQMRRAAISIPSNIAEGFHRRGSKEFQHFVSVALGSCAELESLLWLAEDQELIARESVSQLRNRLSRERQMLGSLAVSLERRRSPFAVRPSPHNEAQ